MPRLNSMTAQARSYSPGTRPLETINGPRPNECKCSWAWSYGVQYLKFLNRMCLVHVNVRALES